jgi:hypothetical protein
MARGKSFAAMSAKPRHTLTIMADGKALEIECSEPEFIMRPKLRATAIRPSGKRLKQTRSTPKPTAAQVERWDRMRTIGCIACLLNEIDHDLARVPRCSMVPHSGNQEIHHLTSGGRRLGHDVTICLCRYHHEGDHLPRYDVGYKETVRTFGPSFGHGRKPFAAFYGSDAEMLAYQDCVLLGRHTDEPLSLDGILDRMMTHFTDEAGLSKEELTKPIPEGDRGEAYDYMKAMHAHYYGETP